MKQDPYYFEIKDVMTQFVSAFNSIIIKRHDKDRNTRSRIHVRYVYAPKQRIIHDLTNKARHITLPVVAVNITGISRDESRVFNKLEGNYLSPEERRPGSDRTKDSQITHHVLQPVPVNIQVSMSILARYQTDIEQIISNFVPYCDPYIVISWKVPNDIYPAKEQEIRTEVLWDGNLSINYPDQLSSTEPYRLSSDTSFTIKTWLFKKARDPISNIFKVTTNITPVADIDSSFSFNLPFYDDVTERSYINGLGPPLTAAPFLTHVDTTDRDNEILGYNFTDTTGVYLSSNKINALSGQEISPFDGAGLEYMKTLYPTITGVPVSYQVKNDSKIHFSIPDHIKNQDDLTDVIVVNYGGYDSAINSTLHGKGIFLDK